MRLERQFILDRARPLGCMLTIWFSSEGNGQREMSYHRSDIVIFHFAKMSLKAVWEIGFVETSDQT